MPMRSQLTQAATGEWSVGLFEVPCHTPLHCFYGACCPWCAAYTQRMELLELTGEPYVCCAGLIPCGPCTEPQDPSCLVCEVCCCTSLAMSANRFMVQTRFNKMNTPCDDCLIVTTCFCNMFLMVAECFCNAPPELEWLVDLLNFSVWGCMHGQQHAEIQELRKHVYQGPPQHLMVLMPPSQLQMVQWKESGGHGGVPLGVSRQASPAGMAEMAQRPPAGHAPMPMPLQVQCGGCRAIFQSPAPGVTVACPHCGAHNMVPGARV